LNWEFFFIQHNYIVSVSAEKLVGIDILSNLVQQRVKNMMENSFSSFLLNQRQARLINEISEKLDFIVKRFVEYVRIWIDGIQDQRDFGADVRIKRTDVGEKGSWFSF